MPVLSEVSDEIAKRLISMFETVENGNRPVNDYYSIYKDDAHFKGLVLFFEYFHGDTARGVGTSHQTGWTGVVAELINSISIIETESSHGENNNTRSSKIESITA